MVTDERIQWSPPRAREVALFTDLTLHAEALELASEQNTITMVSLQQGLRQRLQKTRLVLRQSQRTVERLMRELRLFGWIEPLHGEKGPLNTLPHVLTSEGRNVLFLSQRSPREFRRRLTIKMQEVYVIPGWFIARLWQINPSGQGEVILPVPAPEWQPSSKSWEDSAWDDHLQSQTKRASRLAREANATAFPIKDEDWMKVVQESWKRLSSRRSQGKQGKRAASFSPRTRLASAMREATISLLFGQVPYGATQPDFPGERPPIYVRTFIGWCPRLESLELVFYTDWHPLVAGRLLFPVSVFRSSAPPDRFELLDEIVHPNGNRLWLRQPSWATIRSSFLSTLISIHRRIAMVNRTLYVSLLDVRDEVCRQLRISSLLFDDFLKQAVQELPAEDFPWSVAIETDVREIDTTGSGQFRRPVYLDNVPSTLIGLAPLGIR